MSELDAQPISADVPTPTASFAYGVDSLTFSDGSRVAIPPSGVVVFVGPNNAGKSQSLYDIAQHIGAVDAKEPRVVVAISERRGGSLDAFMEWLATKRAELVIHRKEGSESLRGIRLGISTQSIRQIAATAWTRDSGMETFGRAVAFLLDTGTRLSAAHPVNSFDAVEGRPSEPIQALYDDSDLERRLSAAFRRAFGCDLCVNRLGGKLIQLHIGERPNASELGGELSIPYQKSIREMPTLHQQGDGMRSFAACLLFSDTVEYPVLLVDEPEAFLHPGQARMIGQHLASGTLGQKRQLLVATHSSEVLRVDGHENPREYGEVHR